MKRSMELSVTLCLLFLAISVDGICEDPNTCVFNSSGQSNEQICKNVNDYLDCFEVKTKDCDATVKNNVRLTTESTIDTYSKAPFNCKVGNGSSLPMTSLVLICAVIFAHNILWR